MPAPVFSWTEGAVADLRDLHAKGRSAKQIAVEIGCPSRNAVIGKLHRLGLMRLIARKPAAPAPGRSVLRPIAVALPPREPEPEPVPEFAPPSRGHGEGVLFLDAKTGQCRALLPETDHLHISERLVCGRPAVVKSGGARAEVTAWCRACYRMVYKPAPGRSPVILREVAA